jgi:hypothetical protein
MERGRPLNRDLTGILTGTSDDYIQGRHFWGHERGAYRRIGHG